MLAYAAKRPVIAARKSSPNTMLIIIGAHVALVAALMSAKMDLPPRIFDHPTKVFWVPPPPTPPVNPSRPHQDKRTIQMPPSRSAPLPNQNHDVIDAGPVTVDSGLTGGTTAVAMTSNPIPLPTVTRSGPQLLTPASELKPPYPPSKLLAEEEAVLKLRLTIDDRGRVVAVDPVGRADPVFVNAARRHLIAHWRYKPALENGAGVASAILITLRFQLEG